MTEPDRNLALDRFDRLRRITDAYDPMIDPSQAS